MLNELQSTRIQCPYCWEPLTLPIDVSAGSHELTEDCTVCCRPIALRITVPTGAEGSVQVDAQREAGS